MQFLYARVSTSDQTAAHQLQQARAAGFDIDEDNVIKDEGVSGVSTHFAERDGGRRLLDKLRPGDVLVVRWLDRLGRNYDDVRDTVQALMRKGVIVRTVINSFTFEANRSMRLAEPSNRKWLLRSPDPSIASFRLIKG